MSVFVTESVSDKGGTYFSAARLGSHPSSLTYSGTRLGAVPELSLPCSFVLAWRG